MKNPRDHFQATLQKAERKRLIGLAVLVFFIIACAFIFVVRTKSSAKNELIQTQYAALDLQLRENSLPAKDLAPRFASFAKEYPSDPYGWQAALTAVQLWTSEPAPNLSAMQDVLSDILPYTRKAPIIRTKVLMVLSGVRARQGDLSASLSNLNTALDEMSSHDPLVYQVQFNKAQILVETGQKAEAIALLKDIQKATATAAMLPNSPEATLGQQVRVWLGFLENL